MFTVPALMICDFQNQQSQLEVPHLGILVHLTPFYPFPTTFSSSRFRISHFLPFGRCWQVCVRESVFEVVSLVSISGQPSIRDLQIAGDNACAAIVPHLQIVRH